MFRGLTRAFSQLRSQALISVPRRNLFTLRDIFGTVKKEFEHSIEPDDLNHNPHTMEATETELFDEDAHEVTAMVTQNTFDLEIMMGDTNPQRNFGTVDNPVLLFSANVGWRYVMCTGMNDEDEGLSHTGVWFILREGPIHRCSHCGQCFKLVNLKDEISPENDYYLDHYMPILEEEMGDDDDMVTRWTFHKFAEEYPSLMPMQNTLDGFILVNADDHDRILTDPAYRMQRLQQGHQTLNHLHQALLEVEQKVLWSRGGDYPPVEYTKAEYEDLITSELAIRKLDRIFDRIKRFHKRAIMEPDDHERREARMNARAEQRKKDFTVYMGTTELEQKYKDYFESDHDSEDELLVELDDEQELIAEGIFNFKNYNFVEEGTDGTVPVVESVFEKKMFKFKHRKWNEDPAHHFIRENRMINRYLERLKSRDKILDFDEGSEDIDKILPDIHHSYVNYAKNEAIQQYKDYYESDVEDLKDFDHITPEEKTEFAVVFKDYAKSLGESKKVFSIKTREYDSSKPFLQNLQEHYNDLKTRVMPEIKRQVKGHTLAEHRITDSRSINHGPEQIEIQSLQGLDKLFAGHIKSIQEAAKIPGSDRKAK